MTTKSYSEEDFIVAKAQLAKAIIVLAAKATEQTGWTPDFRPDAPNNHKDLVKAGWVAHETGLLAIWDGASDQAIYSPGVNGLFRFWHDCGHLRHGKTFSDEDETALQTEHAFPELEAAGIERYSLAWLLYYADTIGQIEYNAVHTYFPDNQEAFDRAYVADPVAALKERF